MTMAKKKPRILFNPKVGMQYYITDVEKNEELICSTLCARDKDQRPYRTPKGTAPGEEFFKVKIGSKKEGGFTIIKLMNSVSLDKCISDCGKYEFTGRRPNGQHINCNSLDAAGQEEIQSAEMKMSEIVEEKPEEKKETGIEEVETTEAITENVMANEFSDPKALEALLGKKN
jgi:hypothetical protein